MIFKCQHSRNYENRIYCKECLRMEIIFEILSSLPKPQHINNYCDKRYMIGRNDMLELIINKIKLRRIL